MALNVVTLLCCSGNVCPFFLNFIGPLASMVQDGNVPDHVVTQGIHILSVSMCRTVMWGAHQHMQEALGPRLGEVAFVQASVSH